MAYQSKTGCKMTERVKRYIELEDNLYDDITNVEYDKACEERGKLKNEMTLEELESLKPLIHPKEFGYCISPLIQKKKQQRVK